MKKLSGFTLIELTIVLMVIGTLGPFFLNASASYHVHKKVLLTRQKQEKLTYSLAAYFVMNSRLPAPSTPSNPIGVSSKMNDCNQVIEGIIPYKTMGLSEDAVKDGFGNYFTYVLVKDFTNEWSTGFAEDRNFLEQGKGVICVNNGIEHLSDNPHELPIAFVLISHGSKGYGRYYKQGNHLNFPCITPAINARMAATERQNLSGGTMKRVFQDHLYSPDAKDHFDQILHWVTAADLWFRYAKKESPERRIPDSISRSSSPSFAHTHSVAAADRSPVLGAQHTFVPISQTFPTDSSSAINTDFQNDLYQQIAANRQVDIQ